MEKQNKGSLNSRLRDKNAILQYKKYCEKELKELNERIKNTPIPDYQKNCNHQWTIFKRIIPGITGQLGVFECPYCEKCGLVKSAL